MRSPAKSSPRPAPGLAARWEYLFHPAKQDPFAGLSLEELQKKGWVIQSTSRTEQGKQTYLLKRPKPGRDAGGTQLMSSKRGGSSGPVSGAR